MPAFIVQVHKTWENINDKAFSFIIFVRFVRLTVRQTGFLIRIALRKMVGEKMSKSTKALSTSK
jgi:hypothetical protein